MPCWRPLLEQHDYKIALLYGGRGKGATQAASKAIVCMLMRNPQMRIVVIKHEHTTVKESILQQIKARALEIDAKSGGDFSTIFEIQENSIKCRATGEHVVFTKGVRASTADNKDNFKGLEDIDLAVVEEAQQVKSNREINTLLDTGIRFQNFKLWMLFNPPEDAAHWLIEDYFDLVNSDVDKYWQPIAKDKEGVLYLHNVFYNNPYLNEAAKKQYQDYQDSNPRWYYNQILGLVPKDIGDRAIVRAEERTNDSWRNPDDNKPWTIRSGFIKHQLTRRPKLIIGIDDGADTVHPGAVLGFHCPEPIRDIWVKEFSGYTSSLSLAMAIDDFINYHKLMNIVDNDYQVIADPSLGFTANKQIYINILGKLDTLDWMRNHKNKLISNIWTNRLIKRTDNLGLITRARCADGLPKMIVIKGEGELLGKYDFGCPDLWKGIFAGRYRWELNKAGLVEKGKLEQVKYITDNCDAVTYVYLHQYPPI